jgi:hypothetical protein
VTLENWITAAVSPVSTAFSNDFMSRTRALLPSPFSHRLMAPKLVDMAHHLTA